MKDIVCFSSTRWDYLWQRPQQIMSRLAQRNRILYIDHFMMLGDRGMAGGCYKKKVSKVDDRIYVFSPRYTSRYNLLKDLEDIYSVLSIRRPVLWVYYPTIVSILEKLDYSILCYDCVDDFRHFSWTSPSFAIREKRLIQASDLIFVTAKKLQSAKCIKGKEVHLVPNGADVKHFGKALDEDLPVYESLRRVKKPVIGFIGAVHEWVDFELVKDMCIRRPMWSFVFVGPVGTDAKYLATLNNILFTGKKDYSILPMIMKAFDACIIPFKVNKLTECVNPIKLYEYLAAGKPVVSTPIPEVAAYSKVVKIAQSADDFIEALEQCMKENGSETIGERLEVANANSWDMRVDMIERLMDEMDKNNI